MEEQQKASSTAIAHWWSHTCTVRATSQKHGAATSHHGEWYFIKKFSGRQICATAHIRWRRQSAIAFCVTLHYLKPLVLQGTLMRSWKTSNNLLLILLIYYQSYLSQLGTILNQLKLLCFLEWITIQSKMRRKYLTKAHYHLIKTIPGILCATDIPQNTLRTMYWLDLPALCVFPFILVFWKQWYTHTHTKERKEKKEVVAILALVN